MSEERTDRLQQRFNAIEESVAEIVGRDQAFGAATVAYLEGVQYWMLAKLRQTAEGGVDRFNSEEANEEIKAILQAIHKAVCKHLRISQVEAIENSKHFKELVDDICHHKG